MKTQEPLQGFILAANHPLIHLSLLVAQPVCFAYFAKGSCSFFWDAWSATFLITHGICFSTSVIGSLLKRMQKDELSQTFNLMGVPVYYYFIYMAHFYHLNDRIEHSDQCDALNGVEMLSVWYAIELTVFYAYILAGILFLMTASVFRTSKSVKPLTDDCLTDGDYLEVHKEIQTTFCLNSFELIVIIILYIAYYTFKLSDDFKYTGSYLWPLLVLSAYVIVTFSQSYVIFTNYNDTVQKRTKYALCIVRALLIVAVIAVFFTQEGRESKFGFWILTEIVYFIASIFFWTVQHLVLKVLPKKEALPEPVQEVKKDIAQFDIKGPVQEASNSQNPSSPYPISPKSGTGRKPSSLYVKKSRTLKAQQLDVSPVGHRHIVTDVHGTKGHHNPDNHEGHDYKHAVYLSEDFYALAFISALKSIQAEYKVSPELQGRNFYACLWIFGAETVIIALIFQSVFFTDPHFKIYTPNTAIYLCRFICTVLLHMDLIEDVKQGITMLGYLNTHPEEFSTVGTPFLIATMQMTGGFLAEITNLAMLATRNSVEYCITFFVAFHLLTNIDNIYAEGVSDNPLLHVLHKPLKEKRQPKDVKWSERSWEHKLIFIFHRVCKFWYDSFYYYFLPFLVNYVPYIVPGNLDNLAAGH